MIIFIVFVLIILIVLYFYWSKSKQGLNISSSRNSNRSNNFKDSKKIRILVPSGSLGTYYDAQIYQQIFGSQAYIVVVDPNESSVQVEKNLIVPINLFIEHIYPEFPSNENWMMVNQEFFSVPLNYLQKINRFLCKSKYATTLIQKFCHRHHLNSSVDYTRHTSRDLLSGFPNPKKDENLFVHFAGKSHLKQTKILLRTWLKFFGESSSRLIITCTGFCLQLINDPLEEFGASFYNDRWNGLPSNLEIWRSLSFDKLGELQRLARFHLCPSSVEGYGHYLNEGRSAKAIIITMDAPPMNELVSSENGILIPPLKVVNSSNVTNFNIGSSNTLGSMAVLTNEEALGTAIQKALSLPFSVRERMSHRSRERYLEDQNYCIKHLQSLLH